MHKIHILSGDLILGFIQRLSSIVATSLMGSKKPKCQHNLSTKRFQLESQSCRML